MEKSLESPKQFEDTKDNPVQKPLNREEFDNFKGPGEYGKKLEKIHVEECLELINIGPEDKYIDFGCGDGFFTYDAATKCKEALGIDMQESRINFAKSHYKRNNLAYVVGDVTKCNLGRLATVCSFSDVLEHLTPEQELAALKTAYNHLDNMGRVFIHVPSIHPPHLDHAGKSPLLINTPELEKKYFKIPPGHITIHSHRSMCELLWSAGFFIQSIWIGTKAYRNYRNEINQRNFLAWEIYAIGRKL